MRHSPVLRQSVKYFLDLSPGAIAVDCTFGLGGHAQDMLQAVGPSGHVYAFEQDEHHIVLAYKFLERYKDRLTIFHMNFAQLQECLNAQGIFQVDGIFFDFGLASPHVDDPKRGFSFLHEGPLDMRFSHSLQSLTAADIVNSLTESELKNIFWQYGEERFSRRIANSIVAERKKNSFITTTQLAELVTRVYPAKFRSHRIHPATKVFQALRIVVNQELEVLEKALPQAVSLLRPSGRLVLISYHSLEDRIVKHFLRSQAASCICPPHVLQCICRAKPILSLLTKKPLTPTPEEILKNPRSRSAKLRAALKL